MKVDVKIGARTAIGIVMVLVGVAFGLWAGAWWAFIGGILDVIREIRAPELEAMNVAMGLAKVIFAALIGVVAAAFAVIPGCALIQSK